MLKRYTTEEFWKLYEKLPEDLQEAIVSEKTGNDLFDICQRNEIKEESNIIEIVGYVFLGVLNPNDLEKTLQEELNLGLEKSKRVALEIERFVLYSFKYSLDNLYKIDTEISATKKIKPPSGIETSTIKKEDTYREPIEEEK